MKWTQSVEYLTWLHWNSNHMIGIHGDGAWISALLTASQSRSKSDKANTKFYGIWFVTCLEYYFIYTLFVDVCVNITFFAIHLEQIQPYVIKGEKNYSVWCSCCFLFVRVCVCLFFSFCSSLALHIYPLYSLTRHWNSTAKPCAKEA